MARTPCNFHLLEKICLRHRVPVDDILPVLPELLIGPGSETNTGTGPAGINSYMPSEMYTSPWTTWCTWNLFPILVPGYKLQLRNELTLKKIEILWKESREAFIAQDKINRKYNITDNEHISENIQEDNANENNMILTFHIFQNLTQKIRTLVENSVLKLNTLKLI